MEAFSYLALGDSYTIGEGVALADNFPYQTVQLLRQEGIMMAAPEIIAATGWTTDELAAAIKQRALLPSYDMVTLLIGVNNQYRGRSVEEYTTEFEGLLQQAIGFAGGKPSHVFALSIPDWGVTPFAAERDTAQIALAIDAYNAANARICGDSHIHYVNITEAQRLDGNKDVYLATDKLHPSALEYAKWADQLAKSIKTAYIFNHEKF
jgi:lysophospholipase L1-like esterase